MLLLSDGLSYDPTSETYQLDGVAAVRLDECRVCRTMIYIPVLLLPTDDDPEETERVVQEYMTMHEALCR